MRYIHLTWLLVLMTPLVAHAAQPPVDQDGRPLIKKLGTIGFDTVETSMIVFRGKLYRFEGFKGFQFIEHDTRRVAAVIPGTEKLRFGNAFVDNDTVYVTCGMGMWVSKDLESWEKRSMDALRKFNIFNTSICKAEDKYVIMFEIDAPKEQAGVAFTARFATSKDMKNWTLTPPECNYAKDRYTAPHCLRYLDGYFYNFYLEVIRGKYIPPCGYETYVVRSKDLIHWEQSPLNPVLRPSPEDRQLLYPNFSEEDKQRIVTENNTNNSDIDMCEYNGQVIMSYCWGGQHGARDKEQLGEAVYKGTMEQFLRGWFQ